MALMCTNSRFMRAVCGLDVHKDTIYLCILCSDGEIFEKVFGVLTHQLHEMRRLLQSHGVTEVTMESTAMYWIPIWRVLEPHFRLKLVNPYFIKQLPGRKSDVKDAQWIAECTMKDLVRGSFVPPERIQQLRQYDRRIFDLDAEIVRKLSKLDGIMLQGSRGHALRGHHRCGGTGQESAWAHREQARTGDHPCITDRSGVRR